MLLSEGALSADETGCDETGSPQMTFWTALWLGIVRFIWSLATFVAPLCFLWGCQRPLEETECVSLLDRYTDKVIDQARPSTSTAERRDLTLAARKKAELDPAFAECSDRVSRAQFDCAMQAQSADQMERCLL